MAPNPNEFIRCVVGIGTRNTKGSSRFRRTLRNINIIPINKNNYKIIIYYDSAWHDGYNQ